ncbi:MAG: DUF3857 domain-containing protein [Woeseiaceae bacterium]|nr:DUF3857 domain-containing protein [Woeseiaceae bacterium]
MRELLTLTTLLLCCSFAAGAASADTSYKDLAGNRAGVYENDALNFVLDLESTPYVVVDFSAQVPDANFAAMRFDPLVFTMAIVEDLGIAMTAEQYADIVATATRANFENGELTSDIRRIGVLDVDGAPAIRLAFSGRVDKAHADYVMTVFVRGTTAYQLTSFATGDSAEAVLTEADVVTEAFSFLEDNVPPPVETRRIDEHRSQAFAYTLAADPDIWFAWGDLADDYPYADIGALAARGYGAVIMPMCWQGRRPTELALLDVFMQRFGEDYPTPFITHEEPVQKDGAAGRLLRGDDEADGELYSYYFWVVANDDCAYAVAAWGPARQRETAADLAAFWDAFHITSAPTVFDDGGATPRERRNSAFFLNQTGLHYQQARSNRDAFRFLSQATEQDESEASYLMNALRVLSDLDAYREAYDWLQPRIDRYGDDRYVKSWDAWLAYQVGETDKAIRLYGELFRDGYREDEEFGVYLGMLADREQWQTIDTEFDRYAGENLTDDLRRIKADLLSKRGRHDEALAILDAMSAGRPFSAAVTYAKIEVHDAAGNPAEILKLANELIDNEYQSLESWFYKGYAEYALRSYLKARESFQTALTYSPTSSLVQDYIDAINGILGEGDNAGISTSIDAVRLPRDLAKQFEQSTFASSRDGYGAFYVNRIVGYDFDGGETVTQTYFQQIKVQDAQGIEQFSTLEFDFDPAFEQLYVNRLVVRDVNGGTIAEADRDAFYVTDTTDGYEASTEQTAHLPVPSLAPGVVIEAVVSKRIGVEAGAMPLEIHYLSGGRPIGYSALFVTGDARKYRYGQSGVSKPRKTGQSLVWELTDPVVYRWEPLQPYFDRILPWVTVGTTAADWNEAGKGYLGKIEDKLDVSRVADSAARLVRGVEDELRKIEILSRYVQKELHYEAIEFGRRAYIPKTARETLRDRYGDCKDHAVLLYAMLNAVNIPAELALVNIHQEVLPELPNVDQFDHMIVSVPHAGRRLFIDTTDKDLNLGTLPPRYMAGSRALVLGATSELVDIPDFGPGDSTLDVQRDIERTDGGDMQVHEIGTFAGFQAAELRGQLRDIEPSELLQTMQRWVADRYPDAIVDDAFVDNLLEADADLVVEITYRLPVDDGDAFRLPGFFEAEYLDVGRQADRRFVFEMQAPFTVSAVTTVRQPASVRLTEASKKPDADESRFGHWRRNVDKHDDRWVYRLEYSGHKSRFPADDYGAYAEFHRRLIGSIEQPVLIEQRVRR